MAAAIIAVTFFPPKGLITVITQKGPGLNEPEIFMASGEFKGYELVTGLKSGRGPS